MSRRPLLREIDSGKNGMARGHDFFNNPRKSIASTRPGAPHRLPGSSQEFQKRMRAGQIDQDEIERHAQKPRSFASPLRVVTQGGAQVEKSLNRE